MIKCAKPPVFFNSSQEEHPKSSSLLVLLRLLLLSPFFSVLVVLTIPNTLSRWVFFFVYGSEIHIHPWRKWILWGRIDTETRNWKNPKRRRSKQGARAGGGGGGATAEDKPENTRTLAGSSAEALLALETRAHFSVSAAVRSRDRASRRTGGRAGGTQSLVGLAADLSVC